MKHNALYWRQNGWQRGPCVIYIRTGDHFPQGGDPKGRTRWWLRPLLDNQAETGARESTRSSRGCALPGVRREEPEARVFELQRAARRGWCWDGCGGVGGADGGGKVRLGA